MERGTFCILLLSGLFHFFSALPHCQYQYINDPKTWAEAQQYCREKHMDLATVNEKDDLGELHGLVQSGVSYAFLGLYRDWGWSPSDSKEGELAYWNWASGEPINLNCGSIGTTGEWHATSCFLSLKFFCYNGFATDISKRFMLENSYMNWWMAQDYCRNNHTGLARVRNHFENEELRRIVTDGQAWIGLREDSWMWSDGSEPSFIPWKSLKPLLNGFADCSALDVNSDPLVMIDRSCDAKLPFFCYSAPVRKQLVRLKLTADDTSVNLKDPAVTDAILKWVEQRLRDKGASKDVKLSWMKLPEKEKRAPKTYEQKCPSQVTHLSLCWV